MQNKVLVFDLDNTLYYAGDAVEKKVDDKIRGIFVSELGMTADKAEKTIREIRGRNHYEVEEITEEFPFTKGEFLEYVCDVDVSILDRNERLNLLLKKIPQRKFIITDSTARHVCDVLRQIGVSVDNFEGIFDGHDMNYLFKHNPRSFEIFLRKYGLKASECILFEDSLSNLKTAKTLGFSTVWISPDKKERHFFVDGRFDNVTTALEQLAG